MLGKCHRLSLHILSLLTGDGLFIAIDPLVEQFEGDTSPDGLYLDWGEGELDGLVLLIVLEVAILEIVEVDVGDGVEVKGVDAYAVAYLK